jgi:LPS-assembly protein
VQNLGPHWQFRSNVRWVSDTHFTEDFSRNLYGYANYYLSSTVGLYGRGQYWDASLSASHYQLTDYTLTKANLPYDRLPEAVFSWERPFARWLSLGLDAQAVRFTQPVRDGGSRVDLKPYVALPLQGAGWFLTPKLAWRYTSYDLDTALANSLGGNRTPSRSLPITSLDAGLQFERTLDRWGERWTQTLEPRLYYLRVPYRDQSDLPLFDTQPLTFSWGQLFRDNRYSGADRQSDANELTLAVTTRMLRQRDGLEKFSASVGQILYFNDSLVTVPGETPVQRGRSAWVMDANYLPDDRWSLGVSYQWDPKYRHQDLASVRARYLIGDRGIVNLAYRYRRNLLEQVDASALYPLNANWSLVGRYYYSIQDKSLLEGIAGVQWESCCIAVRVVARRYVRNRVGDLNTALQVEFELKGLGSAGPDTERVLRRAILGYDRDDLSLTPPSLLNANDIGISAPTPTPSP